MKDRNGQITIPRVDVALDCDLVVNPDRVRAQFEGAVIMGICNALYSNISIKQGRIEQSNFGDYLVARTEITPDTASTSWRAPRLLQGAGNPVCRQSLQHFATRSSRPRGSAFARCPSTPRN